MSQGSLSHARLSRLHDVMSGFVARGLVPGLVTAVCRRGEAHVEAFGTKAVGGGEPMRRDSLFRITSMTKPITAVAAMILVEECRLRLDDPIETWLPELADRQVLKRLEGPIDETRPAQRAVTVRDLLTFRMGFGMIWDARDRPIEEVVVEQGILTLGGPLPAIQHSPDEWLRRFATLPLMAQPGEKWMYNTSYYLLGVLIARAAGQPLDAFLRDRIFAPLGMQDTGFWVPSTQLERLVPAYAFDPAIGALAVHDGVEDSHWSRTPIFPDAAAGLVSSIDDYLAFAQMLLNGGKLGTERILSRLSVEAMTTDHLTPEQKAASPFFPNFWDNRGYGFGVSTTLRRDGVSSVPGRYGWDGGYGTFWSNDPHEEMITILMTQRMFDDQNIRIDQDFATSAYQAIDD